MACPAANPKPWTMKPLDSRLCIFAKSLQTLKRDLHGLLVAIKKDQRWPSMRAEAIKNGEDGAWVEVTIGCTFDFELGEISWNYQTGDNSFTGGAYGHPEWFNVTLCSRSSCKELAADLISEIEDRICELASYTQEVA